MTLQTVTVTWTEEDVGAEALGGWVSFQLTADLQDQADGIDVRRNPAKTYFFTGPSGTSDPLVANDSSGIEPTGTAYVITVAIRGQQPVTFTSQLLHASGSSQTLAYLQATAAVPVTQYAQYLPLTTGQPAEGDVPVFTGDGYATTPGTPAGGVQIGGDLGGTDSAPQVTGTHLGAPLPVTQGGSGVATQQPGSTPACPLVMAPVKWALVSFDTGPDEINAVYDNKRIAYRYDSGASADTNGATAPTQAITLPVQMIAGDTALLFVCMLGTGANQETPQVSSNNGTTWTAVPNSPVLGPEVDGFTTTLAVFERVLTSGDPGSVLTVSAVSGRSNIYIALAAGSWAGAGGVDAAAGIPGASLVSSANAPAVTSVASGDVAVYAAATDINGTQPSGTVLASADGYAFQRQEDHRGGVGIVVGDSGEVWPAGTALGGSGVVFSGFTEAQACTMTVLLSPSAAPTAPTLTANSNGALVIDGGSPAVGDRVLVMQNYGNDIPAGQGDPSGIYTVTSVGSPSSPWVMTRASDMDTSAQLGQFWAVTVQEGINFGGGGSSRVVSLSGGVPAAGVATSTGGPFIMGLSLLGAATQSAGSVAYGEACVAVAPNGAPASAYGTQSTANGSNTITLGNSSVANGGTAIGSYSNIPQGDAVTIGRYAYAALNGAIGAGAYTSAYTPDQTALASGMIATQGDSQRSVIVFAGQTSNATPLAITPKDGAFAFRERDGQTADWTKTVGLKLTAMARRKDAPGTDSWWSAQGVVRGNGSSSYSWVGGTAPVFSVTAQDSGASTWAVAIAISSNGLAVTVTGANGETVNWAVIAELYEVAG